MVVPKSVRREAADLLLGHVVVPRLKPATGIGFPSPTSQAPKRDVLFENCGHPASRLVASQNLWPRHLLPFMRWLLDFLGASAGLAVFGGRRRPEDSTGQSQAVERVFLDVKTNRLQISARNVFK